MKHIRCWFFAEHRIFIKLERSGIFRAGRSSEWKIFLYEGLFIVDDEIVQTRGWKKNEEEKKVQKNGRKNKSKTKKL